MDDEAIEHRLSLLADQERALEESHIGRGLTDAERSELRSIEVSLDQCWDLLRQRRARREAGQRPDTAATRPEAIVEHYQQ